MGSVFKHTASVVIAALVGALLMAWCLPSPAAAAAHAHTAAPSVPREAVYNGPQGVIVLTLEVRACPDGSRHAVWTSHDDAYVTVGCWFYALDTVWVLWSDGDRLGYPRDVFVVPEER